MNIILHVNRGESSLSKVNVTGVSQTSSSNVPILQTSIHTIQTTVNQYYSSISGNPFEQDESER